MKIKSKWFKKKCAVYLNVQAVNEWEQGRQNQTFNVSKVINPLRLISPPSPTNLSSTLHQIVKADVLWTGKKQSEFPFPTTETKCRVWDFDLGSFQTELHETFYPKPFKETAQKEEFNLAGTRREDLL